jgi:hypothetical protein
MCVLTVALLRNSTPAISVFANPAAISLRTSGRLGSSPGGRRAQPPRGVWLAMV